MMSNTASATAQSSIAPSNLQAVQRCDEELREIYELFKEVYKEFKKDRKGETRSDFFKKANAQFKNYKNNSKTRTISNEPRNICLSTLKVTSEGLSKFKEFLLETSSAVKEMVSFKEVKEFTKGTLAIMGSAHSIGAVLLVVVALLERWETISKNKEECLGLLEKMTDLVSYLYQISRLSTEFSQMENPCFEGIINECMETIMDGYGLIWCTLTVAKKKRFLIANTEKDELAKLKDDLDSKCSKLMGQILINLYISAPLTRPHDFESPPEAVGLMDEVRTTIDQMEWEDNEKALAVVLHGHRGSGKTTLGDAVFYSQHVNKPPGFSSDGRCAVVRLWRGMNPFRIMEAQKLLINDLGNSISELKSTNEGRNKIGNILQNIPAFIYIDNVEGAEELKEVLPCDLKEAKKLRLLLTCRDRHHCMTLKLSKPLVFHKIKRLSEEAATEFIKKHLEKARWFNDTIGKEIDTIGKEIADMCRGIPLLLDNIVSYLLNVPEDVLEDGLKTVKSGYENCFHKFGKELTDMLGLKELEDEERQALLDILYFFKQEKWDEVKYIVRPEILSSLADRSLVEKTDEEGIKFDEVLSYKTEKEARETRFTTEQQIQKFLRAENHPRRLKGMKNIKGISVPSTMDIVIIPHTLLDHVQGSIRVLKLGMKGKIKGECEESFEKLIYLDCRPFIQLETPNLRCLRLLSDVPDIEVDLCTFWLAKFENLQEVREIQISGSSLKTLPNDLNLLKKLQVLKLICCRDLKDLGSGLFLLSQHQQIKLFLCDHVKSRMEHIIHGLNYVSASCHVNASI